MGDMEAWPFAEPPNTGVYTTQAVMDGGPVRDVHHDDDGDWRFLCGTTSDPEDGRLVHLGHIIEMSPSLASLADLRRGWWAGRCDEHEVWDRHPITRRARVRALLARQSATSHDHEV